jgi:hypothetical protein
MATTPPHAVRVMRTQHLMRRDSSLRKYVEICDSSCLIKTYSPSMPSGLRGARRAEAHVSCCAFHSPRRSRLAEHSCLLRHSLAQGEMLSGSSFVSVSSAAWDSGAQLAYCGVDMHGPPAGPWPEGPGRVHSVRAAVYSAHLTQASSVHIITGAVCPQQTIPGSSSSQG